ncbi:hypothetical protein CIRG_03245 [Coccidioides immitis RMSCC 2394]|uniref:Protein kinase domain-containing protein n=1 Tax=Coccidioides immitis RMSCC 2394 TaxID=404692 RepID=A0A0J6Y9V6_COCIT|nr:hypothetical protein CIRG_03245 [Coccidioides immitis RMSCC 2394]
MELDNVRPAEVVFKEKLFASEFSEVFLTVVRGQQCVMKVARPLIDYSSRTRSTTIAMSQIANSTFHTFESTAYPSFERARNIVSNGIVPSILLAPCSSLIQSHASPYLRTFVIDEYPPSAIFLEYIPNLEMLGLNNYTQARMNKFLEGIREIHKALVEHGDPKPRNMLIVKDDPERVVWIDFNRANTYDEHRITDRERAFLDEEEETVEGLKMCLRETGNQSQSNASDNLDDDYVASRSETIKAAQALLAVGCYYAIFSSQGLCWCLL